MDKKKHIIIITLFALLIANLSGAHGHYCFDGQEPVFSIHFDNVSGHVELESDGLAHHDADMSLGSQILIKFFQADLSLLIPLFLVIYLLTSVGRWSLFISYSPPKRRNPLDLLPPLRAPPCAI